MAHNYVRTTTSIESACEEFMLTGENLLPCCPTRKYMVRVSASKHSHNCIGRKRAQARGKQQQPYLSEVHDEKFSIASRTCIFRCGWHGRDDRAVQCTTDQSQSPAGRCSAAGPTPERRANSGRQAFQRHD